MRPRQYWADLAKKAGDGSGSPFDAAIVATALGRKEEALDLLERAYELHEFFMSYVKVDPAFYSLRSEPRFRQILKKMGLEA